MRVSPEYLCGVVLSAAVIGFFIGNAVAVGSQPVQQSNSTTANTVQYSDSQLQQTLEAVKNDSLVNEFCQQHGFATGYPASTVSGGFYIACYDKTGDVDRRQEFPMFEDFANYVESSQTKGDSR